MASHRQLHGNAVRSVSLVGTITSRNRSGRDAPRPSPASSSADLHRQPAWSAQELAAGLIELWPRSSRSTGDAILTMSLSLGRSPAGTRPTETLYRLSRRRDRRRSQRISWCRPGLERRPFHATSGRTWRGWLKLRATMPRECVKTGHRGCRCRSRCRELSRHGDTLLGLCHLARYLRNCRRRELELASARNQAFEASCAEVTVPGHDESRNPYPLERRDWPQWPAACRHPAG